MANGYFERGEIYWVRMDNGFGGEQGVGRPGLIVSDSTLNTKNQTVVVVFLTTKPHTGGNYVTVEATGTTSYVMTHQVMTYDKSRFGKYMGALNRTEQKLVDDALENVFDLGYVDDTALQEKESEIADRDALIGDLKSEMAGVATEIAKRDEEIASLKMEIEMWQKCYGRCMDMLVDTKVNGDLRRRTAAPAKIVDPEEPVITPKLPDPPKNPDPVEPEDDRLDINNCTATALKKIGFSLAMARKIVAARPFKSVEDLKRVNGLKATQYKIMEPKLCCSPVVVVNPPKVNFAKDDPDPGCEKVNVNAVTARQLHELTGIALSTCYCIKKYQKDNGPYKTLDEIKNAKQVTPGTIDKRRHLLEV